MINFKLKEKVLEKEGLKLIINNIKIKLWKSRKNNKNHYRSLLVNLIINLLISLSIKLWIHN